VIRLHSPDYQGCIECSLTRSLFYEQFSPKSNRGITFRRRVKQYDRLVRLQLLQPNRVTQTLQSFGSTAIVVPRNW
jgi:hypothetical protein